MGKERPDKGKVEIEPLYTCGIYYAEEGQGGVRRYNIYEYGRTEPVSTKKPCPYMEIGERPWWGVEERMVYCVHPKRDRFCDRYCPYCPPLEEKGE